MADPTLPIRSDTTLTIKPNTTPEELALVLAELLPGILERRFKMDPVKAKAEARLLAPAMAAEHQRNSSVSMAGGYLRASGFKLECGRDASQQECEDLRNALKPLVDIRVAGPSDAYHRTSRVQLAVGILWAYIVEATGGRDRDWEREQQTPNAVVGIRG